jgi:MoaA/NifB/PqqE/SkfB family radical SAM enzyme
MIEIVRHLKSHPNSPAIKIVTNGSYRSKEWWKELGTILTSKDSVIFSVDGWDNESNNKYRIGSDFDSIVIGIKEIVKSKASVRWATVIFKFNQDKIDFITDLARSLGVDYFDITKSTLFGSVFEGYKNPTLGYDPLEPDYEWTSKYGRHQRYTVKFTSKQLTKEDIIINKNNYIKNRQKYIDNYVIPLCKCVGLFYIDVEGVCYPCSWISHPFGTRRSKHSDRTITWEENYFLKFRDKMNLNLVSFDEMWECELWNILEGSWYSKDTCFIECESKCINKTVPENEKWRKQVKKAEGALDA